MTTEYGENPCAADHLLPEFFRNGRVYRLDGSEPLPPELAHLASDAPYVQCDKCGRHEYDRGYASGAEPCQFPQPDHSRCDGTLQGGGNA